MNLRSQAAILAIVVLFLVPFVMAEKVEEHQAISLITKRPALDLLAGTKTTAHAVVRVHFWVGKDGAVEAVEQVCGERALFDDVVDALLDFEFQPRSAFVTDLTFERSGRKVLLQVEMPEAQRHKPSDCSQ